MDNFNGKIINAEEARTDLVDALANLLHVLKAEGDAGPGFYELEREFQQAYGPARSHYEAETDGPLNDGLSGVVIVTDGEGKELARYGEE